MRHSVSGGQAALSEQLLLAMAEELKLPLLNIARSAELASLSQQHIAGESLRSDAHAPTSALRDVAHASSHAAPLSDARTHSEIAEALQAIQTTADGTIRLLDSYLFGARLALERDYRLSMEPVSVASVLYDTGQQLSSLAKLYGVDLKLAIPGKFEPVMANRQALQSALTSLGWTLIEALPSISAHELTLSLAAHRCRYGIVAGVYSDVEQLTTDALRQGRKLHGHVRQPLATLSPSGGAGVFVADAILQAMDSELKPTRHRNLYGLGAVLQPTPQIQLI